MFANDVVVNLVELSGGELIGRTRLQKEAYLLHCCGANLRGLSFTYHHYGPYSFELADGWVDAKAAGRIVIREEPGQHGVPDLIFKLKGSNGVSKGLGSLSADVARARLDKIKAVSNVVLELAAAIVFLRKEGHGERTLEELKARKPLKATDGRISKATELLNALNLRE